VPHINHVNSNVIAYASVALIRYNHNKIVWCYITILTIWEVILGFVMFSKLKDMLVALLVDVPFTTLRLKSRVRKISCVLCCLHVYYKRVFSYGTQCLLKKFGNLVAIDA
jgi:hypothetical protein